MWKDVTRAEMLTQKLSCLMYTQIHRKCTTGNFQVGKIEWYIYIRGEINQDLKETFHMFRFPIYIEQYCYIIQVFGLRNFYIPIFYKYELPSWST